MTRCRPFKIKGLSPVTTNRRGKNDEKCRPSEKKGSSGSVCAVRAYLRCNRSVDENFLPGIRVTITAAAAAVGALRSACSDDNVFAEAMALRAEAAVVDESSFVSAVSLAPDAVGEGEADAPISADRIDSPPVDSKAAGGSSAPGGGDGCAATAAMAAARIGLPCLDGENTRAAAAAIRASLDWSSWMAISCGIMELLSPPFSSGGAAGGGGSFIVATVVAFIIGLCLDFCWRENFTGAELKGSLAGPTRKGNIVSLPSVLLKNSGAIVCHVTMTTWKADHK